MYCGGALIFLSFVGSHAHTNRLGDFPGKGVFELNRSAKMASNTGK